MVLSNLDRNNGNAESCSSCNSVCRIVEDEIVSLLLSFRTDEDDLLFVAAQIE